MYRKDYMGTQHPKIIQLQIYKVFVGGESRLVGLCEDGSLYYLHDRENFHEWKMLLRHDESNFYDEADYE